ncbi:heme ABC transporter ATP-binding protein [Kaistia algarum]|uniref:ABC transporter ATP-binding protein n=1 Tax=Kaistia algarum TaxID=2083279 RepID=UPI000CE728BC|nr:ABC transporter ATP-binding protein [Kaistia algarum]MCX5514022.1 ABC transporter ATP-binding protein [Kaistia algarum]PPE77807.1 heme ABC transporter ATP-binding protein [Kaistia algarum]
MGFSPETEPAPLSLSGVTVRFGNFIANDSIDFSVGRGEIHALLGENGAGKTTLMRVVAGLQVPQQGTILINGQPARLTSALDAAALGVGMVHQHFMLIPTLTVAQNVCIGIDRAGRYFPRLGQVARELDEIGERYNLRVDPHARVGDLSVASQQRVEIVKALYRGARILVLDEPTAVLAPQEVEGFFHVLRRLAEAGTAIVFISHKLGEVMALSHRVSVLRHGRLVASMPTSQTNPAELARLMIGEDLTLPVVDETAVAGPIAIEARGIGYVDERQVTRLSDVSLAARSGEIVSIAGVDGNGQHELAELLAGLITPSSGTVIMASAAGAIDVSRSGPAERIALGLSHIPEDRQRTALVDLSIAENAVLETIDRPPLSRRGLLSLPAIETFAKRLIADNDVRCIGPRQRVMTLSGGNQQKVVLGRALSREPSVVIAVQPTRGLDIGATAFVHQQLLAQRARGAAIVLVSTELDEVLALSDRIVVMFAGRIVGSMLRRDVTLDRLGAMMTGHAA